MSGFGLVRNRARFGGWYDAPCIEEDGDQHVAHDVHARAGSGDDPIHRHDEWNGRDDDLIRQALGGVRIFSFFSSPNDVGEIGGTGSKKQERADEEVHRH